MKNGHTWRALVKCVAQEQRQCPTTKPNVKAQFMMQDLFQDDFTLFPKIIEVVRRIFKDYHALEKAPGSLP